MRKFMLLAAGVALSAGTLTACITPPPPPPPDPHDILVVGDSVAFSFGCALGDEVPPLPEGTCPTPAGATYTTKNFSVGACTIYGVTVLLYNGNTAGVPNCGPAPAGAENRTWAQAADHYQPKVVIINTGGWEIVDRWLSFTAAPDSQWGGPEGGQAYQNAAVHYSSALFNAINEFRARGAKVLIANQPHADPPQPVPPPAGVPAGLECSWWEPFDANPPFAVGDGAPLTCPGQWRSPTGTTSYRSSHAKFDQFNDIVQQVKDQWFGGDPFVQIFNFKNHFNRPSDDAYTDYVCPPPDDTTQDPIPDVLDQTPNCPTLSEPTRNAILARAPDNGHLSPAGQQQILRPYLDSCVRFLLGQGGLEADCA